MYLTKTALAAFAAAGLWLAAAPAGATDPTLDGRLPVPANRIVGLWSAVVEVGPCGGTPSNRIAATIAYHAGGTLSETNVMPISGIPNMQDVPGNNQRGPGMGTWSYNPRTGQYTLDIRFNWYVDGVYHGYQLIHRPGVMLSADRNTLSGPVQATRYYANGSKYMDFCGRETATRL